MTLAHLRLVDTLVESLSLHTYIIPPQSTYTFTQNLKMTSENYENIPTGQKHF